jgi:hypothetical protein
MKTILLTDREPKMASLSIRSNFMTSMKIRYKIAGNIKNESC